MSSTKDKYEGFIFSCDTCADAFPTGIFQSFMTAWEKAKAAGWLYIKHGHLGLNRHFCSPGCKSIYLKAHSDE